MVNTMVGEEDNTAKNEKGTIGKMLNFLIKIVSVLSTEINNKSNCRTAQEC